MDPMFSKDITVVYDNAQMIRGHSSHTGAGTIIEFHTGLVLDSAVLSKQCHGCTLVPKEGEEYHNEWKCDHVC